jgi:hypothetical protein
VAASHESASHGTTRRGAACILIVVMLMSFVIVAAITVDFAWMQLVRTELRTATDAAAKAGAEALARTQSSTEAVKVAKAIAAANRVGGRPFAISDSDVTLGRVGRVGNGPYQFTAGSAPFNAVYVNGRVGQGGVTPAVPTFFGAALGQSTFSTHHDATAARQEVEVCLCLDRSGSMMFDMSGTDWSYASNNPLLYPETYYPNTRSRNKCSPPHPTLSRWANLMTAVNTFLDEAGRQPFPPRTALVTWSNSMTLPYYPNTTFTTADTNLSLPDYIGYSWSSNRSAIESSLSTLTANPLGGGTNLSAGLDRGVAVLTSGSTRPLTSKVVILLTDGQWNQGRNPIEAAHDARTAGVTVHTISMLTSTQAVLTDVASITGGNYYPTSNATELQNAFREIARQLPVVLTD